MKTHTDLTSSRAIQIGEPTGFSVTVRRTVADHADQEMMIEPPQFGLESSVG
jgi:hypothetical protein